MYTFHKTMNMGDLDEMNLLQEINLQITSVKKKNDAFLQQLKPGMLFQPKIDFWKMLDADILKKEMNGLNKTDLNMEEEIWSIPAISSIVSKNENKIRINPSIGIDGGHKTEWFFIINSIPITAWDKYKIDDVGLVVSNYKNYFSKKNVSKMPWEGIRMWEVLFLDRKVFLYYATNRYTSLSEEIVLKAK